MVSLLLLLLFFFFFFRLWFLSVRPRQCGTSQIDEDGLFELVRTKPGDKTSYEPPIVEKNTKKKEKAEPVESLSQGRDQCECDSSQLSERSVSSPTTQTLSSPALKGECFKPFQQLAQEHDFTVNLIHISAVCLKFLYQ